MMIECAGQFSVQTNKKTRLDCSRVCWWHSFLFNTSCWLSVCETKVVIKPCLSFSLSLPRWLFCFCFVLLFFFCQFNIVIIWLVVSSSVEHSWKTRVDIVVRSGIYFLTVSSNKRETGRPSPTSGRLRDYSIPFPTFHFWWTLTAISKCIIVAV